MQWVRECTPLLQLSLWALQLQLKGKSLYVGHFSVTLVELMVLVLYRYISLERWEWILNRKQHTLSIHLWLFPRSELPR